MVECIDDCLGSDLVHLSDFMFESMSTELMHPNERKVSFVDLLSYSYTLPDVTLI